MKHNIMTQNNTINNVKIKFKSIIDGILNRYDNYIYYKQLERFYKGQTSIFEQLGDKVSLYYVKVSLATACFSYNTIKHGLRRKERNS